MKPIPESIETATELGRDDPDVDVLQHLQEAADAVSALVPDCIGLSLTWVEQGVTFTLVATDEEIAVLDGVQYLLDGPSVEAVATGRGVETTEQDLMDEDSWQLYAQATAARTVRSTLTLPLLTAGRVTGSANLYAASDRAFDGHHQALATILGGSAPDIVRNADLSFTSRRAAEESPAAVRSLDLMNLAVGILVGAFGIDGAAARRRLDDAALRAGLTPHQLATALVSLY